MYDAVSCEGGVWERLAECVEAPVRQLVPLNKSWAALARDDQSALWRVLLRRLPGRRGVHAPCDGDVVRCGEARTWRDAFEGLETARYCWEAGGGPARRVFRITVAVRFRPTVRDAGGDDDAAAKVTIERDLGRPFREGRQEVEARRIDDGPRHGHAHRRRPGAAPGQQL